MEQLISFVAHNFYFVIIVVGVIYSMFFRKSPLERKPNRMPDFGGAGRPAPQRQRPPAQRPEQTQASRPPAPREQPRPAAAPARADVPLSQAASVAAVVAPQGPQTAPQARRAQPRSPAAASSGVLSRQDLKRAIVWAEIVGPPRARKPYGK
ncbi:hypothetical protein ACFPPD_00105 [Cohnella suwonensis]|uniref:Uncharacterized protein n=1 Tax=Cohnella suwonensis TaxID=696072 RepID=A0ABW0LN35_9BACL